LDGERVQRVAGLALGYLLASSDAALAHGLAGGAGPGAGVWNDRLIETILAVSVLAFAGGFARARIPTAGRWPVARWRVACFYAAIAVLAIALLSPIDALADVFFSVHMGQHLMLMLVAAPLLAVSDAHLVVLRLLPLSPRRRFGQAIGRIPGLKRASQTPIAGWAACGAFAAAFGLWHTPAAYDWALHHPWGHALEHLTLFVTAVAFWRMIVTSGRRRLSPGMAVMMVSLIGVQGAFMGAVISFAQHPLYAAYAGNSLDDQALAGVLMCVPASLIYVVSSIWALARMLRAKPVRSQGASNSPLERFLSPNA
jgi:cytochrome c oxidase assembly factor CtaG